MKIQSFKANFISPIYIKEKENNNYKDKEVSFVEFKKNSTNDVDTIQSVTKEWNTLFSQNMFKYFVPYFSEDSHLYGIVNQKENLKKVKPENVMGLILIDTQPKNKYSEIKYLQVNPQYMHIKEESDSAKKHNEEKPYSGIGQSILNKIKNIYEKYLIEVLPASKAESYYKQNGFEESDDSTVFMQWEK